MAVSAATASNSTQLERDARLNNSGGSDTAGHGIAPGEIAIGVIIGRTSEFFDFFVYAIASVLVFPSLVFPYVDALTGTMYSFALFALAFIARPIGTALFSVLDRRHGRSVRLTVALFLLGLGWSLVVLLALLVARRRTGRPVRELVLDPSYRVEVGFLALASLTLDRPRARDAVLAAFAALGAVAAAAFARGIWVA